MNLTTLPITHQTTIPKSYLDELGHMNVMWYMHLFTQASYPFFALFGMDRDYCETNLKNAFVLEHHIRYLREVHVGNHVTVRTRILGRSAKRIHYISFLTTDTTDDASDDTLSATAETVGIHIDMRIRRSAPFDDLIAANIDRLLAEHRQLDWDAPICGTMKP